MSTEHRSYGSWAVVTGASDGIGREIARCLARRGYNLVVVARRVDRLDALATELATAHRVEVEVVALDLADQQACDELLTRTASLDVGLLVQAAGFGGSGPLTAASVEHELSMLDVNCRVVLALAHHFGRRFVARGGGGIIFMSSLLAFQGVPRAANYAATKAYVQSLAEGLRWELRPHGVDVLASAPGPVHSGFATRANMKMGAALKPAQVAEATVAALGRRTTVRPGWLSKLLEWSLAILPRFGRTRMVGVVMKGMTKHHGDVALPKVAQA